MEKWSNHIDITNNCHISDCVYCSRFERHVPKEARYNMSLEQIEKILLAYKNARNQISLIGGEPQLHPQFKEICELLLKHNPKTRYGLWTSINPEKSKYKDIIKKTFNFVAFNEHNENQLNTCKHQPLTTALIDMVVNSELRKELVEQCYFKNKWCSTVNPLGAYHCEIAASIGYLFNIPGWEVKENWWLNDWHDQYELCLLCGGCIPQERQLICNKKQKISKTFLKMLIEHNCNIGDYELIDMPYSIQYLKDHSGEKPGAYRGDRGEIEDNYININWKKYEN
jgi:organic radical activating enzyme